MSSRVREQNGGTRRGNRQREEGETAGSIWNDGNRDRRDGKRTRIALGEITRARLHLHEEKEGETRRQSHNWDSTRRTTKLR